ncbi:MAG: NUDIX hydrolase [Romboutsia sp.]
MEELDLTFHTSEGRFNYRVGAIIIKNNKLLVVTNRKASYFYSVGGRVNYNETCEEAIKREVREELGIDMDIDRAIFFHEQFFDEKDSKEHFHEIAMYYLMKVPDNISDINCCSVAENGIEEEFTWLPIDSLSNYTIFPTFFTTELLDLPKNLKSIVEIQKR